VEHDFPVELAITIEDMEGKTVRRICARQGSRPESLESMGSGFTWDGLTNAGEVAPEGLYRVHVKAYVNGERYEIVSDPVILLGISG